MAESGKREVYVTGSGPVWVPRGRLHEISRVVSELHDHEARRAAQVAMHMRRVV